VSDWRDRLRLVVVTATITSLAWILIGALLYTRQVAPRSVATANGVSAAPAVSRPASISADPSPPAIQVAPGRLVLPVQGVAAAQLVDTWGQSRAGGARVHEAIDIMAPRGTPVLAAAAGLVEKLFVSVRGGITIYVRSPDRRTIYYYAHLDRYAPGLAEKQAVQAGQVIGYVGATGDASPDAPHLHFAIARVSPDDGWWQGTPVNPYPLLRAR
jgi:murein DD-endopeptidase MepM/ murein hydrolase activator NlpD